MLVFVIVVVDYGLQREELEKYVHLYTSVKDWID